MKSPSAPQLKLLEAIESYQQQHRYAPTVREMQEQAGYATPSAAHFHILRMRTAGLVDWVEGQNRTLHVTQAGRRELRLAHVRRTAA